MKNGVFWVVTPCGSCKNPEDTILQTEVCFLPQLKLTQSQKLSLKSFCIFFLVMWCRSSVAQSPDFYSGFDTMLHCIEFVVNVLALRRDSFPYFVFLYQFLLHLLLHMQQISCLRSSSLDTVDVGYAINLKTTSFDNKWLSPGNVHKLTHIHIE
jgi:hypothetical protein